MGEGTGDDAVDVRGPSARRKEKGGKGEEGKEEAEKEADELTFLRFCLISNMLKLSIGRALEFSACEALLLLLLLILVICFYIVSCNRSLLISPFFYDISISS